MNRRRFACLGLVVTGAIAAGAMAVRATAAPPDAPTASIDPWVHPPTVDDPRLEHRRYFSAEMRHEVGYQVCLPPDYSTQPARRFPVLYWLHDRGGNESDPALPPALLQQAIRDRILPPFIVIYVCGGGDTFYTDAVDGSSRAARTFLHELIPEVDRTLRTIAGREGRAVQGIGMGGFGAFKFALSQPEMFSSALAYSGAFFSVTNPEPQVVPPPVLRDVIGRDPFRIATNHPAFLAGRHRDRLVGRTGLRLVVSNRDRFGEENRRFRESLRAARLTPEWAVIPVGTNDPVVLVQEGALEGLEFAVRWLGEARSPDRDGPWVNAPTNPPPRVRHHLVYSEILGRPIGYSLSLPPGRAADETQPLPVIYHLHGRGEDESRHLETVGYLDTAMRIGEVEPTAWVWVYAGRSSWFADSFDGRVPAETVLMTEVIPRIEERWRVGGIAGRAVDGWGMGGFGALRLAARHPGFFKSVLVHNPLVPDVESAPSRLPDAWVAVFDANPRFYSETEPLALLARQAEVLRPSLKIRVVVGERAAAIADARRLKDRLEASRLPHEYEEVPGAGGNGPELFRHTGLRDLRFLAGAPGKG